MIPNPGIEYVIYQMCQESLDYLKNYRMGKREQGMELSATDQKIVYF